MAVPRQPDLADQRLDRVARCWLCGIRLPIAQMVPDGGSACLDVRWYCRDMRACTGRWTIGASSKRAAAATPASDRSKAVTP